jgi:hypothetical protein
LYSFFYLLDKILSIPKIDKEVKLHVIPWKCNKELLIHFINYWLILLILMMYIINMKTFVEYWKPNRMWHCFLRSCIEQCNVWKTKNILNENTISISPAKILTKCHIYDSLIQIMNLSRVSSVIAAQASKWVLFSNDSTFIKTVYVDYWWLG